MIFRMSVNDHDEVIGFDSVEPIPVDFMFDLPGLGDLEALNRMDKVGIIPATSHSTKSRVVYQLRWPDPRQLSAFESKRGAVMFSGSSWSIFASLGEWPDLSKAQRLCQKIVAAMERYTPSGYRTEATISRATVEISCSAPIPGSTQRLYHEFTTSQDRIIRDLGALINGFEYQIIPE